MIEASPLGLISMLGTFLCLVLAAFLFAVPSRNGLANRMLAAFLILTAMDISAWFMGAWWQAHPTVLHMRLPGSLMQMPFFVGFVWFSCFEDKALKPVHTLLLVPAIAALVASIGGSETGLRVARLVESIQYYPYIAVACWILWRFHEILRQRYSNSRSATLEWLTALVAASLVAHSVFMVRIFLRDVLELQAIAYLQVTTALLVLGITLWIAFKALLAPHLFRGVDGVLASAASDYRGGDEPPVDRLENVQSFIAERESYLDADLTLSRLARQMGRPQKELSEIINQRAGVHFFDFINRHRVAHAKRLIVSDPGMAITDVIYASGFNSKSSFNTAFKKHQGQTPSAFRTEAQKLPD